MMGNSYFLISGVVFLCGCYVILGEEAFQKANMPRFTDVDTIELHHLRSFPLQSLMSDAGSFKLQTSGIALRSTLTSAIVVLEFRPRNVTACFLPIINKNLINEKGRKLNDTLTWDKRSKISYAKEIDSKYWMQSTFLGIINGVVYRNYLDWVERYLLTNAGKYFTPQSICSGAEEESCFTLPSTGDTFLASSLSVFAELSVQMHAIIPPRASEVHLLSFTEPRLFSISNSDVDNVEEKRKNSEYTGMLRGLDPGSNTRSGPDSGSGSGTGSGLKPVPVSGPRSTLKTSAPDASMASKTHHPEVRVPSSQPSVTPSFSPPSSVPSTIPYLTPSSTASSRPSMTSSSFSTPNTSSVSKNKTTSTPYVNTTVWYKEKEKEDNRFNTTVFKDSDVTDYFVSLILCMQAYEYEYFAEALKSCMRESDGFIHVEGGQYYHIRPRHPFAFKHDYWQAIPVAVLLDKGGRDISDIVISLSILVITIIGLAAALWRLKMFDFLFSKTAVWRERISATAPSEGGYSSAASELPIYRVWGRYNTPQITSYKKLHTEDLDLTWTESEKEKQNDTERQNHAERYSGIEREREGERGMEGQEDDIEMDDSSSSNVSDENGGSSSLDSSTHNSSLCSSNTAINEKEGSAEKRSRERERERDREKNWDKERERGEGSGRYGMNVVDLSSGMSTALKSRRHIGTRNKSNSTSRDKTSNGNNRNSSSSHRSGSNTGNIGVIDVININYSDRTSNRLSRSRERVNEKDGGYRGPRYDSSNDHVSFFDGHYTVTADDNEVFNKMNVQDVLTKNKHENDSGHDREMRVESAAARTHAASSSSSFSSSFFIDPISVNMGNNSSYRSIINYRVKRGRRKTSRKSLRSYGQSPDNSELNSSSFARTTIAFPLTSPVSTSHSHSTALPPSDTISLNIYPRRTFIPKDRPIPLGKISGEFNDSEEGVEMSDVDLVSKPLGISTVPRPKIHPPSEKNGVRSNSTDAVSKVYFMDLNGQDLHQNQLDPSATIRDEEKTHDFAERNLNQHHTLVSDASDSNTDGTLAPLRRDDNGDKHSDSYNNISAINKLSANTNSDSPEKKSAMTPNDNSHYGILRLKI